MWKNAGYWPARLLAMAMALALGLGLCGLEAHAQASGTISSASAKIRQEPSTQSAVLGSLSSGATVTLEAQTQGADGMTWYQVSVEGGQTGYIRSDLVTKGAGDLPTVSTGAAAAAAPGATAVALAPTVEIEYLQPVAATVTGGQSVRARADASTSAAIVATVSPSVALQVMGRAQGADGNTWYLVEFDQGGGLVNGFIRADFVSLSGEALPLEEVAAVTEEVPESEPVVEEVKEYETVLEGETWYLVNQVESLRYDIVQYISASNQNAAALQENIKTVKIQKIAIVVLVLLSASLGTALAIVLFRRRERDEDAYTARVERETQDRRRKPLAPGKGQSGKAQPPRAGAGVKPPAGRTGTGKPVAAPGMAAGASANAVQAASRVKPAGAANPMGRGGQPPGQKPGGVVQGKAAAPGGEQAAPPRRPAFQSQTTGPVMPKPPGLPQAHQGGAAPAASGQPAPKRDILEKPKPSWQEKDLARDDGEFEFEVLDFDD